jgi:hypothetical protein
VLKWLKTRASNTTSFIAAAGTVCLLVCVYFLVHTLTCSAYSVGSALTDTLDDLISEQRLEPQLAIKILLNYDRAISEILGDKVKARLTFKVGLKLLNNASCETALMFQSL